MTTKTHVIQNLYYIRWTISFNQDGLIQRYIPKTSFSQIQLRVYIFITSETNSSRLVFICMKLNYYIIKNLII